MTREDAIDLLDNLIGMIEDNHNSDYDKALKMAIKSLEQEPKTGHCKDCKYFEYNRMAKVDGIPLIIAHEICNKWGDGCQSKEDGYCFLFEPKMQEVEE